MVEKQVKMFAWWVEEDDTGVRQWLVLACWGETGTEEERKMEEDKWWICQEFRFSVLFLP